MDVDRLEAEGTKVSGANGQSGRRYRDTPAVRDGYKQIDATSKELTDRCRAGREEVAGVAPRRLQHQPHRDGRRYLDEQGAQGAGPRATAAQTTGPHTVR